MYLIGHTFKIIAIKRNLVDQSSCKILASWLTGIKYIKQFRKWLEARKDQQTAKKAWGDYIVNCYNNKLDLACDKKPLAFLDINRSDLRK